MSFSKGRKNTPRGQMSSSGSGPAIQMMPPHIRATFMPDPPLRHLPAPGRRSREGQYADAAPASADGSAEKDPGHPGDRDTAFPKLKRGAGLAGVASFLNHFERTPPPPRKVGPTPRATKEAKAAKAKADLEDQLRSDVEAYRTTQKAAGGEYDGMNCYRTLFVGRLAYEVTERKLLREMEAFGAVKDIRLIKASGEENGDSKMEEGLGDKSRGYAFVEYEHEDDMKRAYRGGDGMRIEGRSIVVDVERGHTVPSWLPRRLGGGLGGTRLGGKDVNHSAPGRFDPSKPLRPPGPPAGADYGGRGPPYGGGGRAGGGYGYGGGPPPPRGGYNGGFDRGGGGPPPGYGRGGHGDRYNDRGGGGGGYGDRYDDRSSGRGGDRGRGGGDRYYDDRGGKRGRSRSRSPDRDRRRGRY